MRLPTRKASLGPKNPGFPQRLLNIVNLLFLKCFSLDDTGVLPSLAPGFEKILQKPFGLTIFVTGFVVILVALSGVSCPCHHTEIHRSESLRAAPHCPPPAHQKEIGKKNDAGLGGPGSAGRGINGPRVL